MSTSRRTLTRLCEACLLAGTAVGAGSLSAGTASAATPPGPAPSPVLGVRATPLLLGRSTSLGITVTDRSARPLGELTLSELLPAGVDYVAGSATLHQDGRRLPLGAPLVLAPSRAGGPTRLVWAPLPAVVRSGHAVELALDVRSARLGLAAATTSLWPGVVLRFPEPTARGGASGGTAPSGSAGAAATGASNAAVGAGATPDTPSPTGEASGALASTTTRLVSSPIALRVSAERSNRQVREQLVVAAAEREGSSAVVVKAYLPAGVSFVGCQPTPSCAGPTISSVRLPLRSPGSDLPLLPADSAHLLPVPARSEPSAPASPRKLPAPASTTPAPSTPTPSTATPSTRTPSGTASATSAPASAVPSSTTPSTTTPSTTTPSTTTPPTAAPAASAPPATVPSRPAPKLATFTVLTWNLGDLGPGKAVTLRYTLSLASDSPSSGRGLVTASATAPAAVPPQHPVDAAVSAGSPAPVEQPAVASVARSEPLASLAGGSPTPLAPVTGPTGPTGPEERVTITAVATWSSAPTHPIATVSAAAAAASAARGATGTASAAGTSSATSDAATHRAGDKASGGRDPFGAAGSTSTTTPNQEASRTARGTTAVATSDPSGTGSSTSPGSHLAFTGIDAIAAAELGLATLLVGSLVLAASGRPRYRPAHAGATSGHAAPPRPDDPPTRAAGAHRLGAHPGPTGPGRLALSPSPLGVHSPLDSAAPAGAQLLLAGSLSPALSPWVPSTWRPTPHQPSGWSAPALGGPAWSAPALGGPAWNAPALGGPAWDAPAHPATHRGAPHLAQPGWVTPDRAGGLLPHLLVAPDPAAALVPPLVVVSSLLATPGDDSWSWSIPPVPATEEWLAALGEVPALPGVPAASAEEDLASSAPSDTSDPRGSSTPLDSPATLDDLLSPVYVPLPSHVRLCPGRQPRPHRPVSGEEPTGAHLPERRAAQLPESAGWSLPSSADVPAAPVGGPALPSGDSSVPEVRDFLRG